MDNNEINRLTALAAKAVGGYIYVDGMNSWIEDLGDGKRGKWWNPGRDDGDAFRLAVKLKIRFHHDGSCAVAELPTGNKYCWIEVAVVEDNNHYNATCLAILRAAAVVGEAMGNPATEKEE